MEKKKIITEDFFIGNLGNPEVTDTIKQAYALSSNSNVDEISEYDYDAETGATSAVKLDSIRKCHVSWLDVKKTNFIENGFRNLIESVNDVSWKINLKHEWETDIQFTKYIGKGEHYDWHRDHYPGKSLKKSERRISIVYSLSNRTDYEGGLFQIKKSNGAIHSVKFDYGDFIIFPSIKLHRVKPLKSGTRITMVGWYR